MEFKAEALLWSPDLTKEYHNTFINTANRIVEIVSHFSRITKLSWLRQRTVQSIFNFSGVKSISPPLRVNTGSLIWSRRARGVRHDTWSLKSSLLALGESSLSQFSSWKWYSFGHNFLKLIQILFRFWWNFSCKRSTFVLSKRSSL